MYESGSFPGCLKAMSIETGVESLNTVCGPGSWSQCESDFAKGQRTQVLNSNVALKSICNKRTPPEMKESLVRGTEVKKGHSLEEHVF